MPYQCVHCSKMIEAGTQELLEGCASCGGKFFYYIRKEKFDEVVAKKQYPLIELKEKDKEKIESDVRNILNIEDEDEPVILDIESVRVLGPGKFEIDIVQLMNRKPIVFKLHEGKYVIDLESGLGDFKSEEE